MMNREEKKLFKINKKINKFKNYLDNYDLETYESSKINLKIANLESEQSIYHEKLKHKRNLELAKITKPTTTIDSKTNKNNFNINAQTTIAKRNQIVCLIKIIVFNTVLYFFIYITNQSFKTIKHFWTQPFI